MSSRAKLSRMWRLSAAAVLAGAIAMTTLPAGAVNRYLAIPLGTLGGAANVCRF